MHKKLNVISLFSGAGGLDYAFQSTGHFSTSLFVEKEDLFAQTIEANQRSGLLDAGVVLRGDISSLDPAETVAGVLGPKCSPWGVIGGPPCESFSSIGKQMGRFDKRGAVIFSYADWVNDLPVQVFLMENVPGLLNIENGKLFRDLLKKFEQGGYNLSHSILCAADFGAPTVRRRLFVVGVRDLPKFEFPTPSHQSAKVAQGDAARWVSSATALRDLPPPAERRPGHPQGHVAIKHTDAVRARFECLAPGSVDKIRKRNRLHPDLPSPGLYAGNMEGIRFHIHPTEPREITNREAARIQGFPDDFLFSGSRVAVGKQIANAVPIALGRALGTAMHSQYFQSRRIKRGR